MANVHSDKPKVPEAATRISRDVTNSLKFTLRGGGGGLFKGAPTDGQQPVFQPIELNLGREAVQEIIQAHRLSVTRVHSTLNQVGRDLQDFFPRVPEVLPPRITGQALNPDGTAAASVTVEALKPESLLSNGGIASPWPTRRTVTDHRGVFSLSLPTVPVPERGLRLRFQGGTGTAEAVIPRTDLLDKDGRLGVIALSRTLREAPRSILARLADVVPASGEDVDENPEDFVDPAPVITLGEEDCARSFRSNNGVIDRFDYAILIRLIDPQLSQQELTLRVRESGGQSLPLPVRPRNGTLTPLRALMVQAVQGEATTSLVDRTPIDVPIDVAAFHEDAATDPLGVPEAASLGLGYIVNLHQIWIPVGLSLGDLSYSLPLAPGEEQSIAVFEQNQALEVRDTESLSIAEAQRFDETADSSTLATFESAFREAVRGGSTFDVDSTTGGAGLSLFGGLIGSASKLLLGGACRPASPARRAVARPRASRTPAATSSLARPRTSIRGWRAGRRPAGAPAAPASAWRRPATASRSRSRFSPTTTTATR
jgi:hypothetical protein